MSRLYFLWDYDLNEKQVQAILRGNNETEKLWLTGRILSNAQFEDVWKYLTVQEIVNAFPKLKLKPAIQKAWKHALEVWGYHV